jgi:hypothetical protein
MDGKYTRPELTTYGNVEDLTRQGGGDQTDVPAGVPIGPIDDITDVTS